jgi:hypothetical protein
MVRYGHVRLAVRPYHVLQRTSKEPKVLAKRYLAGETKAKLAGYAGLDAHQIRKEERRHATRTRIPDRRRLE